MESFSCDAVVIGAGAVGLAVARALALAGRETLILERHGRFGSETSARNSEVIHAGIYYPQASLKARLCVEGKAMLYDFAQRHQVPHRRIGKWLVASETDQIAKLAAIRAAAQSNGVDDLVPVSAARVRAEEPELRFTEVVESPSTGIIDSHAYMLALLGAAQAHDAQIIYNALVERIERVGGRWRVWVRNEGAEIALDAAIIVNSAGLWAQSVARTIDGLADVPPLHLAKGSYAALTGRSPFSRLIYPMPEPGGLGVHLTLDMGGQARFGPNVEWLDHDDPARIDYTVRPDIGAAFAARVRGWWPGVDESRLHPAYAGVRPKWTGRNEAAGDFRIDGPAQHGLPGLVNLFGIESPGLTSSLAIAAHVEAMLR